MIPPFLRKVFWLVRRRQKEVELEQELQFHLDEECEERAAGGAPVVDARRAARRNLGNLSIVREDTRAVWTSLQVEQLVQDLRYGTAMLWRNKTFSAMAILSGAGSTLAAASPLASIIPAWWATRVDPIAVLRAE